MTAVLPLIAAAMALLSAPQDFDAASGYRTARYRGVVPQPPPGVPRIDAARVAKLADAGHAILIDVAPAEGGLRQSDGAWRLATEHRGIPGSAWFPEAGRGAIDPAIERWLLGGVARLTRGRRSPVIIFCLADCWMSWNAALRLHRAGVRNIYWFAEGADGWRDLGRPLIAMTPYQEPR